MLTSRSQIAACGCRTATSERARCNLICDVFVTSRVLVWPRTLTTVPGRCSPLLSPPQLKSMKLLSTLAAAAVVAVATLSPSAVLVEARPFW